MKTTSSDLRERIVNAVLKEGMTRRGAADHFRVSHSTAVKIVKLFTLTGSAEPKRIGGYRKPILEPHKELIIALVESTPDMTLEEIRDEVHHRTGLRAGVATVDRMVKTLDFDFKKKASSPTSRRARTSR